MPPNRHGRLCTKDPASARLSRNVHSTAESATRPGDDDNADIGVHIGTDDGIVPLIEHLVIEGVETLRLVQRNRRDALADGVQNRFVGHEQLPW